MRKFLFIVGVLFAITIYDVSAEDITPSNLTEQRIDSMERSLQSIQKQLNIQGIDSKKGSGTAVEIDKVSALIEEIKSLRVNIESMEERQKKLRNNIRDYQVATTARFNAIEKNSQQAELSTIAKNSKEYVINNISKEIESTNFVGDSKAPPKNEGTVDSETEYQKAYMMLKHKGESESNDYNIARIAFDDFIKKHPNDVLTGNAYYWLGEINVKQQDYNKAAIDYLNGYKANSISGRASYNLIGLANSLLQLGKNKEACSTLNKLYDEFKDLGGEVKRNADAMYKEAGCSKQQ